jgi:Zn-dependent alcohol dehydrogenase
MDGGLLVNVEPHRLRERDLTAHVNVGIGQGSLMIDELISRRYPLSEINDAYDALGAGEVACCGSRTGS